MIPMINRFPFIAILFISTLSLSLLSCATTSRTSAYFKLLPKDTTIAGVVKDDYESIIQPGDILAIKVNSLSASEDAYYNNAAGENVNTTAAASTGIGFLVMPNGMISFHSLGQLKATGFTRREFAKDLQTRLSPFLKEAVVSVNYLNHKVTVMGAVGAPRVLPLNGEQISIIDLMVLSGDITENGKYNDVIIIRDEGNNKIVKHVNLEDKSIFTSPWYFIKSNDIVFVPKDADRIKKENARNTFQTTLGLVVSGIGLLTIILTQVIK